MSGSVLWRRPLCARPRPRGAPPPSPVPALHGPPRRDILRVRATLCRSALSVTLPAQLRLLCRCRSDPAPVPTARRKAAGPLAQSRRCDARARWLRCHSRRGPHRAAARSLAAAASSQHDNVRSLRLTHAVGGPISTPAAGAALIDRPASSGRRGGGAARRAPSGQRAWLRRRSAGWRWQAGRPAAGRGVDPRVRCASPNSVRPCSARARPARRARTATPAAPGPPQRRHGRLLRAAEPPAAGVARRARRCAPAARAAAARRAAPRRRSRRQSFPERARRGGQGAYLLLHEGALVGPRRAGAARCARSRAAAPRPLPRTSSPPRRPATAAAAARRSPPPARPPPPAAAAIPTTARRRPRRPPPRAQVVALQAVLALPPGEATPAQSSTARPLPLAHRARTSRGSSLTWARSRRCWAWTCGGGGGGGRRAGAWSASCWHALPLAERGGQRGERARPPPRPPRPASASASRSQCPRSRPSGADELRARPPRVVLPACAPARALRSRSAGAPASGRVHGALGGGGHLAACRHPCAPRAAGWASYETGRAPSRSSQPSLLARQAGSVGQGGAPPFAAGPLAGGHAPRAHVHAHTRTHTRVRTRAG